MISTTFDPKHPNDVAAVWFDTKRILAQATDTLASAEWQDSVFADTGLPGDLVVGPTSISGTRCTTILSSGTAGRSYYVTLRFEGASGQVWNRTFEIAVEQP
ncbi:hypothetical protein ACFODL_15610 [Phenylobacterium terrae]|uniref:Uncharacterized protein n=1 Tax=Phenylobacterium terrae TaxID=2665495 RepID=A0ABW4N6N2_9CAUL